MASKLLKQLIIGDGDKHENILGYRPNKDRPLILRYFCSSNHLKISIIHGEIETECKVNGLKSLKRAYFVGCCGSRALFTSDNPSHRHIVVDASSLSSNRQVMQIDDAFKGGDLCGFFYHPLAKESRILNVRKIENNKYEYRIYLFNTRTWRRTLTPYFSFQPTRRVRSFNNDCCPQERVCGNPAITNNALHWDIGRIMVFDMVTEEFSIKSLPFIEGYSGSCRMRHLLAIEDKLCLCYMGYEEPLMDMWVLGNYKKWTWVKRYTFNLDWDMKKYPMEKGFKFETLLEIMGYIRVIGIQNGELVLFWKHRGIFCYHLGFGTLEKINMKKSEMDNYIHDNYDWLCGFEAYDATSFF